MLRKIKTTVIFYCQFILSLYFPVPQANVIKIIIVNVTAIVHNLLVVDLQCVIIMVIIVIVTVVAMVVLRHLFPQQRAPGKDRNVLI